MATAFFMASAVLAPALAAQSNLLTPSELKRESDIKSAYLYNFARFVIWPENALKEPDGPLTVCVIGETSLRLSVGVLQGKKVGGHALEVALLNSSDDPLSCHVVFCGDVPQEAKKRLLAGAAGLPILTVSDQPGFTQSGGIVRFFRWKNNIRFEVNLEAARRSGLHISSRLLRLARIVGDEVTSLDPSAQELPWAGARVR